MAKAYPLQWPDMWPRTEKRTSSQFKTSLSKALKNVENSLRLFGSDSGKKITDVVISSNVTLGEQRPKDPGVAVYFTWDDITTCIPVDRYTKVEDNLQAIHHLLEADRVKLRHGGLHHVRATYRGYEPLPPPCDDWAEVLNVDPESDISVIRDAYRKLRSDHHPDHDGDAVQFHRIKQAYDAAMAEKGS